MGTKELSKAQDAVIRHLALGGEVIYPTIGYIMLGMFLGQMLVKVDMGKKIHIAGEEPGGTA